MDRPEPVLDPKIAKQLQDAGWVIVTVTNPDGRRWLTAVKQDGSGTAAELNALLQRIAASVKD